jgi:hypothetical protein
LTERDVLPYRCPGCQHPPHRALSKRKEEHQARTFSYHVGETRRQPGSQLHVGKEHLLAVRPSLPGDSGALPHSAAGAVATCQILAGDHFLTRCRTHKRGNRCPLLVEVDQFDAALDPYTSTCQHLRQHDFDVGLPKKHGHGKSAAGHAELLEPDPDRPPGEVQVDFRSGIGSASITPSGRSTSSVRGCMIIARDGRNGSGRRSMIRTRAPYTCACGASVNRPGPRR